MKRKTMLPWMGGKSKLAPLIINRLPAHRTYVEPFTGGGAIFWNKGKSAVEILNDADSRLVTLYRVFKSHPDELKKEMRWLLHSREEFSDSLAQPGLTDIQRAARFLFILKACFGGRANNPSFGYAITSSAGYSWDDAKDLIAQVHERLKGVTVEHGDFAEVIARYDSPETLFYCDPPYVETAQYKERFSIEDHLRLENTLAGIKGTAIVSLNDHPQVRGIYRQWHIEEVETKYTIGKTTDRDEKIGEVLISREPLADNADGGLFG
ncbi:MAG: DNA adenine methylase [Planctomycetes bacterium]|nr:DNA adenine methylase [Planctomycetota bacterium]